MKELISLHSAAGQILTLMHEQDKLSQSALLDDELKQEYKNKVKQLEKAYTFMLYHIISKIEEI